LDTHLAEVPEVQRAAFISALSGAVAHAQQHCAHLGMLLIDLTNLARINHYHGYSTGDLMLAAAYRELLGVSKLPDTVFRVGSHRFAFILPGLTTPAFIALALNKVTRLLEGELFVDAGMVSVELKVGISINLKGGRDPMTMLALAESSLAHVKMGGSHRIEDLLGEGGNPKTDYQLEQRFAQALRDNDFELHFQPKVDLITGRVGSAEALLRWTLPGGEPVSPEMLVALADAAGRAFELTKWVVHQSMRQLKSWQHSLDVGLALNIQAGLVGSPDLPAMLCDAIAIWGVDPARVTVEITEGAIIEDKESGFDNLLKLKNMGINLSIDDFGTGYSSLSYFKHIPAAELKIDRTFVSTMMVDSQNLELVKIMIYIAHQFGLSVVAEGVEDRATMQRLRELDCDSIQGYYFSEPLPAQEFESWVRDWPGLSAIQ
jgi:diguanylate cyclase (GGDEF)-like protein